MAGPIFAEKEIRDSLIGLLSYPRSGNTWLRYSIEYLRRHWTTQTFR